MKPLNVTSIVIRSLLAAAVLSIGFLNGARAGVSYTTAGATYSQDFDSLPNSPENTSLGTTANGIGWTDDNASPAVGQFSIAGWYLYHPTVQSEGGVNGHQRMRVGAGTANTGAFMSFGSSGSSERALGDIGSNTLTPTPPTPPSDIYIGLLLHNDTGQALGSFTLSYFGEQWRDGGATTPNAQTMTFGWSTTATSISDDNSLFTWVSALNFTSPVFANAGSGTAVDGNSAGRLGIGPVTVTGINWLPDTDLWLRWDDVNNSGNDHGLAIDDVAFYSSVPEPGTCLLAGMGAALLLILRRRN